jgi:phage tail-like protein
MPETGARLDPFTNFNFLVEIDGITRAAFHECSGLDSTMDVIEHREGGRTTPLKLPGMTRFPNVVLRRGVTDDRELYEWHQDAVAGNVERRNGSIVILDRQGNEQTRWNFISAWPLAYRGPALTSEGNDVAIESFELAHEGLERE